jgi:hypothetical protein
MLHEPRPAPRIVEPPPRVAEPAPRIVEPAPRVAEPAASNGVSSPEAFPENERQVVLRGLRPPTEPSRGRRARDLPQIPREEPAKPRREAASPPAAAARSKPAEPAPRTAPSRTAARSEPGKGDAPAKADVPLAPTWRKFLDRLTGTFDARTATPPPAPRASAPASTGPLTLQPFAADLQLSPDEVAPDEVAEEPAASGMLKGLTLPTNGELAPQWRKFLDRPESAEDKIPTLDEAKIAVVRGYLQREFPLCTVYDFFDFQRNAQVFQLQDNHGKVTQLITMTAEFFDTHRDLEIRAWIEKHRLAHAMRQAGQSGVLVSQSGLQMEKR